MVSGRQGFERRGIWMLYVYYKMERKAKIRYREVDQIKTLFWASLDQEGCHLAWVDRFLRELSQKKWMAGGDWRAGWSSQK